MKKLILILFLAFSLGTFAQVEHVPIYHPVYDYLLRAENKGFLKHKSLSQLPLQRKEIVAILTEMKNNPVKVHFSENDASVLEKYLKEFEIIHRDNAVVFYSDSDSNQVLFSGLIGEQEKFVYRHKDAKKNLQVSPLGSLEGFYKKNDANSDNVVIAQFGGKIFGTINDNFGYNLQATNGTVLSGNHKVALEDPKIAQNIKFVYLNSDFDVSESHIRYDNDWFYAIIGRENRTIGAGLNQHLYLSTNAPPMDGVSVGAKFKGFEYRFSNFGLLGYHDSLHIAGSDAIIPAKYLVTHRFAIQPEWGEIGLSESIIYSNRAYDLAYINPLSFFKSLEHALRDRDNSLMGVDLTFRPINNLQIKGTYFLDDIIFSKIGTGYWSNKSASNIAIMSSLGDFDLGAEYARVEPYTYTHFNFQNALTNDSMLFAGSLQPNSDETSFLMQYWYGNRYPIKLRLSYIRHGKNELDSNGKITKNVGGDVYNTINWFRDSGTVTFLDGNREKILTASLEFGYEFTRGFHLAGYYKLRLINDIPEHIFRFGLKFEDF